MLFFREIFRTPAITGAIAPSSRHLARSAVETGRVASARSVIELGPGTGIVTEEILRTKPPEAAFLVIERNEAFVRGLRRRFPGLDVVDGCASRLGEYAGERNMDRVDCVICGIPWSLLPEETRALVLQAVREILAPGGRFVTYTYFGPHLLPTGRAFRAQLRERFPEARATRPEFRNFPPAFCYHCRVGTPPDASTKPPAGL